MIGQVKTTTPRLKRLSVGLASKDPTCSPFSTASSEKHYAGDHVTPGGQRMSLHENLLMRILSTPSESPLHDRSPDDDAVSTTTPQRSADDSFDSCLSGSATPVLELLNVDSEPQPGTSRPEGLAANPHMMRLFRDLNSPSATSRLRALRALKSPSKRVGYFNFDVPHEQQDIITSEERDGPVTRNIKDVLRDVVVYVEVRSGSDNRSNGIKQHIASLGARVNERLLKDTTHVIFKDGLLSTFQKAKKMNIPVVSILWIEACKRHTCLMNPSEFKISNLERYENPELFKRIRRQKSMQPGAQEKAGNKKRPVVAAKGSAVLSPPTKLPTLHRLGKNDRLEQILNDFDNQVAGTNSEPVDEYDEMLRAGPMRLLERFRSTPTAMDGASISSPAAAIGTATADDENATDGTPTGVNGTTCEPLPISRRALFSAMKKDKSETATPRTRRKTILLKPQMTKVAEEPTASKQQTPVAKSNVSNRRKTIVASVSEDSDSLSPSVFNPERTGRSRRNTIVVTAEINVTQQGEQPPKNKLDMTTSKLDKRRKTVVDDNLSASKDNSPPPVVTVLSKRTRRKTIAFVNDENTPPSTTAGHALSALKSCTGVQYGSIYSPKDMDFSQAPNGPSSNELAKGPSNGTTMSVSTTSGNDGTGMSIVEKTDASAMAHISVGRQTIFEPPAGLHSTQQSIEMALASPCNGSRRRTTLSTTRSNTFSEPLQLTASATKSLSLSASRNLTQHGRGAPTSSPKVTHEPPKTLLQEYQSSLRFDSARAPERRRQTVFDITMDIVDQRLSEINRRAAAAKESRQRTMTPKEKSSSGSSIEITPAQPDLKTPPPATQQTSLNEYFKKTAKSVEKSTKSNDSTVPNSTVSGIMESSELTGESVASDVPRKRKLFNVQTLSEDALVNKPNGTTVTPKPTPKRRSLAPAAMAPNLATQSAKKRRTTMFFVSPVPAAESQAEARRKQPHVASRGLPTVGSQYPTASRNYLATTNLHTEQSAFVKEALRTLGGFIAEPDVTDNTTHLVTLEPRRTVNLLRALIRGLWIVRYEWIVESVRQERWLPEEQFEVRDFSTAVQINRSERQAFGSNYRNALFADYGPFWISRRCAVPAEQLREILLLCRAKVAESRTKAKYLIVPQAPDRDYRTNEQQICIDPLWILDSITVNKVKKLSTKYRVHQ
ncbi:microcephalin [Anopheles bellator]|uniref:microcephalin n=1 Tax=Anopheles bellator TaxID=139047 RepID=UPI0026490BA4|nr:microcephalin [Anopheles bellator]